MYSIQCTLYRSRLVLWLLWIIILSLVGGGLKPTRKIFRHFLIYHIVRFNIKSHHNLFCIKASSNVKCISNGCDFVTPVLIKAGQLFYLAPSCVETKIFSRKLKNKEKFSFIKGKIKSLRPTFVRGKKINFALCFKNTEMNISLHHYGLNSQFFVYCPSK